MCSVEKYIDKKGMIETLSECVAIKSVKADPEDGAPYGKGIADALDFMLETGRKMRQGSAHRREIKVLSMTPL